MIAPDFYNDNDPAAAAWLGALISEGQIPAGRVDDRSILDVAATDLAGFRRVHFFAGVAGWAEALRLADWPEWLPVWTGSPPCQPFSAAGRRRGQDDERHLGPRFVQLVGAGRPPVLFGEQVASSDAIGRAAGSRKPGDGGQPAWAWWDDISLRLEAAGYAAWSAVVPAASVGAPHIRARLFFGAVDLRFAADGMVNAQRPRLEGLGRDGDRSHEPGRIAAEPTRPAGPAGPAGGMADTRRARDERGGRPGEAPSTTGPAGAEAWEQRSGSADRPGGASGGMADHHREGCGWDAQLYGRGSAHPGERRADDDGRSRAGGMADGASERPRPTNGYWSAADWLLCRDDSWRPVEPGTFPLAHGIPGRMGLLRGYGNAIVPQAAAEFITASREIMIESGIWQRLERQHRT